MGLFSHIFIKPINTDPPTIREIGFKEFADAINKFPRTYAHVFTKSEGYTDLESGIMWIGVNGHDYKLYISKCELVE